MTARYDLNVSAQSSLLFFQTVIKTSAVISSISNEYRSLSKTSNRWGYGFPCNASFTRIKDVTLSYNFSEKAVEKMHIGSLVLYVTGRNLATFTKWKGWDPEADLTQRGWGGYENNYPMTKSVVFGANITF